MSFASQKGQAGSVGAQPMRGGLWGVSPQIQFPPNKSEAARERCVAPCHIVGPSDLGFTTLAGQFS
jgi:hypothetical protein